MEALAKAQGAGDRFKESAVIYNYMRSIRQDYPRKVFRHNLWLQFLTKVCFGASDCWYWHGCRDNGGYGVLNGQKAHRVSWRLFFGEIPSGLFVLHKCDLPSCVNPNHLWLGTQKENMQDMVRKGRSNKNPTYGTKNKFCKYGYDVVLAIRSDFKTGNYSQHELARKYRMSVMQVHRIVKNKNRTRG